MGQLRIIAYEQMDNASNLHDKLAAMLMNNSNLQGILKGHLCNVMDKELAIHLIHSYVLQKDNIAITHDIRSVLDVFLNASVRLKSTNIDVYDLAVGGGSVTSMVFIFIQDDILPVGLFVARCGRREYVYAPVLLNGARNIHESLVNDSQLA